MLRGAALLLVFLNHIEPRTMPGFVSPTGLAGFLFWRIKTLGAGGVDLFFVLSGFLISGLLFKEIEDTGRLRLGRFWARRAFKIIPSYYFLLLVLALTHATTWLDLSSTGAALHSFFVHSLFFQNYLANTINGPTWSLAVEEHFYLLLPLLLLFICRIAGIRPPSSRFIYCLVPLLVLPLVFRTARSLTHGIELNDFMETHFRFDGLLFGVLVQWLVRTQSRVVDFISRRKAAFAVLSGLLVLPTAFWARAQPIMFTIGFTLDSIGFALLLILVATAKAGRWHQSRLALIVAGVGTWSYNIYLWHFFLGDLHLPCFRPAQDWIAAHIHSSAGVALLQFLLFAGVSIGIGAFLTQLVEKPFLLLRDRIPGLASRRRGSRDHSTRPDLLPAPLMERYPGNVTAVN